MQSRSKSCPKGSNQSIISRILLHSLSAKPPTAIRFIFNPIYDRCSFSAPLSFNHSEAFNNAEAFLDSKPAIPFSPFPASLVSGIKVAGSGNWEVLWACFHFSEWIWWEGRDGVYVSFPRHECFPNKTHKFTWKTTMSAFRPFILSRL